MSEESFYPPLTFPSHHSRFTLHYPRGSKDVTFFHQAITNKETTKYLKGPFAPRPDTTLQQALEISKKEASDKTRVVFDIHQSRGDGEGDDYRWLGFVALTRMEGEEFGSRKDENDKNSNQDRKEMERVGEMGVILSHENHRNGVLSETIISIYDLAFNSSTPSISDPNDVSNNGFNLDKVFTVTNYANVPMKIFMENVIGLKVLEHDSNDLSEFLKEVMKEEIKKEETERIVVYCLKREDWFGGKREELIERVEKKYLKKHD